MRTVRTSALIALVVMASWLAALVVHERPVSDVHRARPCATQVCEASHAPVEACGVSCGNPLHAPVVPVVVAALVMVAVRLVEVRGTPTALDRRRRSRLLRPPQLALG